jgi:hypothetical protein
MQMRLLFKNIFYSFPIQLLILHFRKYQILLVIWAVLTSTINSGFLENFGADSLFFVPEYMGKVNALSTALVGITMGVFFMSWNITTFILHTKRFKFLATTSKPFLKYCINNSVLPLLFLFFYLFKAVHFNLNKELISVSDVALLVTGFSAGLILSIVFSFAFFFGADRTILRTIAPVISNPNEFKKSFQTELATPSDAFGLKVTYFISSRFKFSKVRPVFHYSQQFLDAIFKRHHFAAILAIIIAFIFLITVGFFLDIKFFQAPAAASIFIFFAIMVAAIGALTYFLDSWSVLFLIVLILGFNFLFRNEIINPRNKAYGLNYNEKTGRPNYNKQSLQQLCTPELISRDKVNMISILENWKRKQNSERPTIILMNVSGGGLRSSTFVMNVLQQLDSITKGNLMNQTFLISGASGGMLSAAYFRELYAERKKSKGINLQSNEYTENIAEDLLNPIFSSMVSRDLFAPAQKFSIGPYEYLKDRGYAFEEKLNVNTGGIMNKQLRDYVADEKAANIPMIIFNSVITLDGRKLMIGTQPLSFMMKPPAFSTDKSYGPDAVDFTSLFARQNPGNIRLLTALRMNATFPYVLPNVWLPTNPVIDVMDAGIKDNFGQETSFRFIDHFRDWLINSTSRIIILQIRDRGIDYGKHTNENISMVDMITRPATILEHSWHNFQDFNQSNEYNYLKNSLGDQLHRLTFTYVPSKEEQAAALNFHLTASEKRDVINSFHSTENQKVLVSLMSLIEK